MELQVLGIGNAFTARRNNTSFLIRHRRNLLIDGPHALFRVFRQFEIDRSEINDVLLTHIHGDHVAGLETLLLWKHYAEQQRVRLYTSLPVFQSFKEAFFNRFSLTFSEDLYSIHSKSLDDYIDFVELSTDRPNPIFEGLSVEIRHNWHPVPTLGLRFLSDQGVIGIGGDTCYDLDLLKALRARGKISEQRYEKLAGNWLWDSSVIYHEADRHGAPHTPEKNLLDLPGKVKDKIRLIHTPDDFQEKQLPLAREGERVTLRDGVATIEF